MSDVHSSQGNYPQNTGKVAMMREPHTRRNDGRQVDVLGTLSDAVRANPMSAALIGMGALWLFMGGNRVALSGAGDRQSLFGAVADTATGVGRTATHAAHQVGDALSATTGAISSTVSSAVNEVADDIEAAARRAGNMVSGTAQWSTEAGRFGARYSSSSPLGNLQDNLRDLFDRHPVSLGIAGIAVGAGIAASLPMTDKEREVMGEASEAISSKVSELTAQAKDLAASAMDEADKQGLNTRNLREVGQALANKSGISNS